MAPKLVESTAPQPTSTSAVTEKTWTTASIVGASIFGASILLFALTLTAFLIHRRSKRKNPPSSHRTTSYHPFHTNSAQDGLLAHAAPAPEKDRKSSMFSRDSRHSIVSLYVDHDAHDKRANLETSSLIPLHVSPMEGSIGEDPMDRVATTSEGSGVSRFSTTSSGGSLGLSRIPVPGQEGGRPGQARRMSSATAARYYNINTSAAPNAPQIPKIVHSISP